MLQAPFAIGNFSLAGCVPFAGLVVRDRILAVNALLPLCERLGLELCGSDSVLSLLQHWSATFPVLARAVEALSSDERASAAFVDIDTVKVHAPFEPRAIYAAGANYRRHVIDIIVDRHGDPALTRDENRLAASKLMDERAAHGVPYAFIKSVASLAGPFDDIVLPPDAREPDWEIELAAIIGRRARHVTRDAAPAYVAGYAIANDITDRGYVFRSDLRELGTDWLSGKSSPTYTPFGPYLVPAAFVDPQKLTLRLALNGDVMQDASSSDMIFDVARLIEYLSSRVELRPGDILLTGSPAGNGTHYNRYLKPGDVMECSITGLGVQRTPCVAEIEQCRSMESKPSSIA